MDTDSDPMNDPRYTREDRFKMALKILRDGRISLLDFILHILQSKQAEFATYRDRFFSNSSGKVSQLLDCFLEDKRGRAIMLCWMEPHAIDHVSDKIVKEMDVIKTALRWTTKNTTPESLLSWNVDDFMGPLVESSAPILGHLLGTAAQTKRAKENNRKKQSTTV